MWNWEQGRLEYFQFDELRKIAKFGAAHDLRTAIRSDLEDAVGLPFLPDDPAYLPWRNYRRLFQVYPWTDRLLEVHHLLPLCSGARASKDGTLLEDLLANCPSCHRAVHRYYDKWLVEENRVDFADAREAREVYRDAKREHNIAARHTERA